MYDVIVNPEVIKEMKADSTGEFRGFLCNLCVQYIEQKYKCTLNGKCKFPRMLYKGDASKPEMQYVRKQQTPAIQEVKESANKGSASSQKKKVESKRRRRPKAHVKFTLEARYSDGTSSKCDAALCYPQTLAEEKVAPSPPQALELTIQFNHDAKQFTADEVNSLKSSMHFMIGGELVSFKVSDASAVRFHPLEVYLPCEIDASSARATFHADTQELHVDLPRRASTGWS